MYALLMQEKIKQISGASKENVNCMIDVGRISRKTQKKEVKKIRKKNKKKKPKKKEELKFKQK